MLTDDTTRIRILETFAGCHDAALHGAANAASICTLSMRLPRRMAKMRKECSTRTSHRADPVLSALLQSRVVLASEQKRMNALSTASAANLQRDLRG